MKTLTKVLSLVLALIMLATVFVACGKQKEDDKKDPEKTGEDVATTEVTTTEIVLPTIDWGGVEYRVLGRYNGTHSQFCNFEIWREEVPEDVVGAAIWDRNEKLKTKYNFVVTGYLQESPASIAKTMFESGEDLYDLIILSPESFQPFATDGYLINLNKTEYINLNHDCWNQYANEQLTMGGKLYYTTNKFLLQDKHRAWCMFVNRDLVRELKFGNIEEMVFDGTWTIDKMTEIVKQGSRELDGQDGMTGADQWGCTFSDRYNFIQLAYGVGFRMSRNGSDGYPELIGATDQMVAALDKVYNLIWDHNNIWVPGIGIAENKSGAFIFEQGRTPLHGNCTTKLDSVDLFNFDYGVLPNPKYDEKQEDYYAFPNRGNGSLLAIPASVSDVSRAGFFLEAISEESVDTSYHAFIETKCKLQDVVDADASKCLDIIFEGIVYDIAFVSDIGGLGTLAYSSLVQSTTNNYPRQYSRMEKIANTQLNKIREAYAAQDQQ